MAKRGRPVKENRVQAIKARKFTIDFEPFDKQQQVLDFYANGGRFCHLNWGRRTGKTHIGVATVLKWAEKGKRGDIIWWVGPSYKQIKSILWRKLKAMFPAGLIESENNSELSLTLWNGVILELKGSDAEDSLRGPMSGLFGVVMEEAAFHKGHVYEQVIRPQLVDQRAPALFCSTPKGRNWFWRKEEQAKAEMAKGNKTWLHIHATVYDNPYISREEIREVKNETSEIKWRQEYMAEYDTATGLVYPEFLDSAFPIGHVVPPLTPSQRRSLVTNQNPIYRSLDWGLRNPTCVLSSYVDEERIDGELTGRRVIHLFQEHYQSEWTVPQHCEKIKGMHVGMNIRTTFCDPSMRNRTDTEFSTSRIAQFAKFGVPLYPANNNVKDGVEVVKRLFREKQITVTADMVNLISEARSYEWESLLGFDDKPVKEKPKKVKDHAMDALKYLCVMILRTEAFQFSEQGEVVKRDPNKYYLKRPVPNSDLSFDTIGGYGVA